MAILYIKRLGGGYHDLYVRSDVGQLSDVFENFRSLCLKRYDLDPSYFVSTAGLTFEAMLECTKVKLELLTDKDMILMVEKGIGGGLTQVVKKMLRAIISTYQAMTPKERVYSYNT